MILLLNYTDPEHYPIVPLVVFIGLYLIFRFIGQKFLEK
jgi:hypothetical protein